jgi:hypothetical protein
MKIYRIMIFLLFAISVQNVHIAAQVIQGTITDALTGNPVPGLEVTVGDSVAYSDSSGHYAIYYSYPPEIVHLSPSADTTINEGDTLLFSVSVTDQDNDTLSYSWFLNGVIQSSFTDSFFNYHTNFTSAGVDTVEVRIKDPWFEKTHQWIITILDVNRAPIISYHWPRSDTTITEKDFIEFNLEANDPDNDPVSYHWLINGQVQVTEHDSTLLITTGYESTGTDTVVGLVSDQRDTVSQTWILNILDKAKPVILFDEAHDEFNSIIWDRAQQIDSNPPNLNKSYFGKFKEAVLPEYDIESNTLSLLTKEYLDKYHLLMLSAIRSPLSDVEINNVADYVNSGGHLFVSSGRHQYSNLNKLLQHFNIQLAQGSIFSQSNGNPFFNFSDPGTTHPIVTNISSIHFNWGVSLTILGDAVPIVYSPPDCWKDVNRNDQKDIDEPIQRYLLMASSGLGSGKIVCYTDNAFSDGYYFWENNGNLILNIINWFPETTHTQTGITQALTDQTIPKDYKLIQNYPNPFNSETMIKFQTPKDGHVMLRVLNIMGQEIAVLMNNDLPAGFYSVRWNGRTDAGNDVPTGIYIYQVVTQNFSDVMKMMLIR